jgi:hypothetical protein
MSTAPRFRKMTRNLLSVLVKFGSFTSSALTALAVVVCLSSTAQAQTEESSGGAAGGSSGSASGGAGGAQKGGASSGSKRTSINFEDQLIEGQAQKPELFYLLQQRNANFNRLIKLRENFIPEMRKTSEDIGRGSGKGNGN